MVFFLEDDNNLKENLYNNNNKRQKIQHYNEIEKKIILPLIIQKYIIELIYIHKKILYKLNRDNHHPTRHQRIETLKKSGVLKYAMVNWDWFKICQIFHHYYQETTTIFKYYPIEYQLEKLKEQELKEQEQQQLQLLTDGGISRKIRNLNLIKRVRIYLNEIDSRSILLLQSYKSLKEIIIVFRYDCQGYLGYENLIHLNELNKDIIIKFKINVSDIGDWRMDFKFDKQLISLFKFEINTVRFIYSEYDDPFCDVLESSGDEDDGFEERILQMDEIYMVLFEFIKLLNPKSLLINVHSSDFFKHLPIYHSISKFNQKFEIVKINGDYIPIFSFYRFLKAPNLKSLDINFQFHFLFSLYNQIKHTSDVKKIYNKFNLNFEEIDNFNEPFPINNNITDDGDGNNEEIDGGYTPSVGIDIDDNDSYNYHVDSANNKDTEINENKQRYCYTEYDSEVNNLNVPKYSRLLWNDCLYQLENNKTITNLSIGSVECSGCNVNDDDDLVPSENQLFGDLTTALSNNKSIKTLTLRFSDHLSSEEMLPILLEILDNNNTLEQLYTDHSNVVMELLKLTKNKICKINCVE